MLQKGQAPINCFKSNNDSLVIFSGLNCLLMSNMKEFYFFAVTEISLLVFLMCPRYRNT